MPPTGVPPQGAKSNKRNQNTASPTTDIPLSKINPPKGIPLTLLITRIVERSLYRVLNPSSSQAKAQAQPLKYSAPVRA